MFLLSRLLHLSGDVSLTDRRLTVQRALVIGPHNVGSLRADSNYYNDTVVFSGLRDYKYSLPVFKAAKVVIWDECDENTIYYGWLRYCFPACQVVIFNGKVEVGCLLGTSPDVEIGTTDSQVCRALRYGYTKKNLNGYGYPVEVDVLEKEDPIVKPP